MRHPPYNLKVNKEADRAVMIETIRRALAAFQYSERDYRYIGLGGPFLEDFKRVHAAFPKMKLLSIEEDPATHLRQEFHRFVNKKYLDLHCGDAHDYIRKFYEPSGKEIIWLDYLDFKLEELNDFVFLATKAPIGTMLRITIRAQWLEHLPGVAEVEKWAEIFKRFGDRFGDLAPAQLDPEDFRDGARYCVLLNNILVGAVRDELAPPLKRYFQPLTATFYRDETRMFSLMGMVVGRPKMEQQQEVRGETCDRRIVKAFVGWDLASLDGKQVHLLDVPALSDKERLALQLHLPLENRKRRSDCLKELPYLIGNNKDDHRRRILRYAALSPYYAQFARLAS